MIREGRGGDRMDPMRATLALLLTVLAALPVAAAPFSVRLGLDKVVLDSPPGFTDTSDLASPRLQDLAATLTSDSNRILLFSLSDADMRRFTQGEPLDARRYMIAVTPKGSERDRLNPAQFAALVAESLRELGAPTEVADLQKTLDARPVGQAVLLGELRRDANAVTILQALRLPPLPSGAFTPLRQQYQAFATTLMLVRGKVLRLSVYTLLSTPADTEWVKTTSQRWIDDLQRLNR